jgi:L-ascorbate metabolism protein UlaG (beta-lactamase superfamily)
MDAHEVQATSRRWTLWRVLGAALGVAVVLAAAAVAALWWVRPGLDALERHRLATPPSTAAELTITWLGTTAVLLDDGQSALMVDPFFTRPPGLLNLLLNREIAPDETRIAEGLAAAGVRRLEAVLVSHSHFDHAMDAGVVARLTGSPLLGSPSTANIGRGAGLSEDRIEVVEPGRTLRRGPYRITFLRSRHAGGTGGHPVGDITEPLVPPARYLDYKQGGTYSILIEHPLGTVLHHGSAGFEPGALQGRRADVVLLGVAVIDDLGRYLHEVVDAVGARRIVPVHWDDFTRGLDEPLRPLPGVVRLDRFLAHLEQHRPELQVQALPMGQRVVLLP